MLYENRNIKEDGENMTDDNIKWIIASEVHIYPEEVASRYKCIEYDENKCFFDISLKLVQTDKVVTKLKDENYKAIVEAESRHSDLITAKYEG